MRPGQFDPASPPRLINHDEIRSMITPRLDLARALSLVGGLVLTNLITAPTLAQIPLPQLDAAARPANLIVRREAILTDERTRLAAVPGADRFASIADPPHADGSSRFEPLDEVVPPRDPQGEPVVPAALLALRSDVASKLFELASAAAKTPSAPLAFIDECLRVVLKRQPDHAEARRLLGFIPHEKTGWATPFAASELANGHVKDSTFGWVPADWVPHLQRGELPAPGAKGWMPTDQADALRRDWNRGWTIYTEHFEIHANVPLSGVIAFGHQLETFYQLFFALMADVIGPDKLPLAIRLKNSKLQPTISNRPRHKVYYFATREEYAQFLAPALRDSARESLGRYLLKKEYRAFGGISYFFNDVGGQLDVQSTLYHEVSHQLLFESAGPDNYARNVKEYWVFEGLGTYFETVQILKDGSVRVGGLVGPRIAEARRRLVAAGEMVPIERFVAMGQTTFQGEDGDPIIYLHYVEAMALAVFLMQANDGRYRESFLDYVRDAYKGQFSARGAGRSLDDRLERPYPDLQREFAAYLNRIVVAVPTTR